MSVDAMKLLLMPSSHAPRMLWKAGMAPLDRGTALQRSQTPIGCWKVTPRIESDSGVDILRQTVDRWTVNRRCSGGRVWG